MLSILLNKFKEVEIGDDLKTLREFSMPMQSKDRGYAIGGHEKIRESHNSFKRQDPFEIEDDDSKNTKEKEAFHFISYLHFNGNLWELDGL